MYIEARLLALEKSERHYRTLLDDSSDPTLCFFPDGTYRYVNKVFATGVNKVPDELIGKTIWDIFPKQLADRRFAVVKKVFSDAIAMEIEVTVPTASTFLKP